MLENDAHKSLSSIFVNLLAHCIGSSCSCAS